LVGAVKIKSLKYYAGYFRKFLRFEKPINPMVMEASRK
jgi:hypothetical protein